MAAEPGLPGPGCRPWCPVSLVSALVTVGLLAGCAAIPDHGPVVSGRPAGEEEQESPFKLIPPGPFAGAGPVDIVRGFVQASPGFAEDHSVARSYLTDERRTTWRPDDGVLLYGGSAGSGPAYRLRAGSGDGDGGDGARVDVTVPVLASVDGEGRYVPMSAGSRKHLVFDLERTGGQWRIAGLADGLLMSRSDFTLTFRSFPIYFPDRTGSFMVPDVHWFPLTTATPAALVSALLAGPAEWLRPAVTTGAPPGTRLAVPAVPVVDDVATVDMTGEARQATPRQRQLLNGQLTQTLQAYGPITGVRLTVMRAAFDVNAGGRTGGDGPGQDAAPPRMQAQPLVEESAAVLDPQGRPARLTNGKLVPIRGAEPLASDGNTAVAMAGDGSAVAVLDGRRTVRYLLPGAKARPQALIRGQELTRPSFDPFGWVWAAAGDGRGNVLAAQPVPGQVVVDAKWLRGYRVTSLRISRDGSRALIAAQQGGRGYVLLSGVRRSSDGQPTGLTEPPAEPGRAPAGLLPDLARVLDAGWVDEDHVVALGQSRDSVADTGPGGSSAHQVWVVQVGGPVDEISPLTTAADTITAGNGELSLVVGTPAGSVYTRAGATWILTTRGRSPAFAG